jgi:hypothetical protein
MTTEITIEKCGHCGAMPTEQEVCEAVRKDDEQRKGFGVCGICGETFKYTERKLTHYYYDGKKVWLVEGRNEPSIWIHDQLMGTQVDVRVHLECFKKAVPGARFSR